MKLYQSDAAGSTGLNGHGPLTDDREQIEDDDEREEDEYPFDELFKAPNYADFIKLAPNSNAKRYERRVASMMKAGMVASLNNQQWADAATFMKHGPGFATAAGNLAAEDARAARLVEMLTAPNSPWVMFALVALPMASQLLRNHQGDMAEAGQTWRERRAQRKAEKRSGYVKEASSPITVRLFKREFKLPIRFRLHLPDPRKLFKAFLAPTQHPGQITQEVFTDPAVVKALHKMGIIPRDESDAA